MVTEKETAKPSVDPTENVKELVSAERLRQDDLRVQAERFAAAETAHVREMSLLRDTHAGELRIAESRRIDALRAGDQQAIEAAVGRVDLAAGTLAEVTAARFEAIIGQLGEVQRYQYAQQGGTAQVVETRAVVADTRSEHVDVRGNITLILAVLSSVMSIILFAFVIASH